MNKESNEQQIVVEDEFCEEISELSEQSLEGVTGGAIGRRVFRPMMNGVVDANVSPRTQEAMRGLYQDGRQAFQSTRDRYRDWRGGGSPVGY